MPFSISGSKRLDSKEVEDGPRASRNQFRVLLAVLLALGVATELGGSFGLARISRIQRRIDRESAEALHLRKTGGRGLPTLLLVGNSLLLEGAEISKLRQLVSSRYEAHRYVIEGTSYLDWYFALKRLFRHGSRPSVVVLALSVGELLEDTTRGDFMARNAMDVEDLPELARRAHLDTTAESNLLFAHYSGWLGARSEIRKWLLGQTLPAAGNLALVLSFQKAQPFTPALLREKAGRLREMQGLCEGNGAKFLMLIPPVEAEEDGPRTLAEWGAQAGVRVLTPVKPGELGSDCFRDGFHLNEKGAAAFTPKLAQELVQ